MGHTRVIYTDATTAEAVTILKGKGFQETSAGGCFVNPASPVKVYVVWGHASYFPDFMGRLTFRPRIQIHLKNRDSGDGLSEAARILVHALRQLSSSTRFSLFDADTSRELPP